MIKLFLFCEDFSNQTTTQTNTDKQQPKLSVIDKEMITTMTTQWWW